MRISDLSSDVCSSDLRARKLEPKSLFEFDDALWRDIRERRRVFILSYNHIVIGYAERQYAAYGVAREAQAAVKVTVRTASVPHFPGVKLAAYCADGGALWMTNALWATDLQYISKRKGDEVGNSGKL